MNLAKLYDFVKIIHRNHLHFSNTDNGKSERKIKVSIPFTTAAKRIKYLGINLPKETKRTPKDRQNYKKTKKTKEQTKL